MLENNYLYLYILNNITKLTERQISNLLLELELNIYSSVLKYKFKDKRSHTEIKRLICKELDLRRSVII